LLHYLENVYIASDRNLIDLRFPVQYVIRPMSHEHHDYRGYAGQVASGQIRPGDEVTVLPSGFSTTVAGVDVHGGPIEEAFPPMSVSVRLADEIDISRGDMLARPNNLPTVTQDVDAMVCWFSERPLQERQKLVLKHTTRTVKALVRDLHYRLDVNTLHRDESEKALTLNDLGRISIRTAVPLFVDEYRRNRITGSFILIDEATFETVGAGMILGQSAP
jgi:sulfate adenylyltransferase subunit 1 (EFTu-like GTPase family)